MSAQDRVAPPVPEIVASYSGLGFGMADDRFDSRTSSHFALDPWRDATPLTRDEDPELVIGGRRVVAGIAFSRGRAGVSFRGP